MTLLPQTSRPHSALYAAGNTVLYAGCVVIFFGSGAWLTQMILEACGVAADAALLYSLLAGMVTLALSAVYLFKSSKAADAEAAASVEGLRKAANGR